MDETELEEEVFALIAEAAPGNLRERVVTADTSLRRDLGLDSLGLATLLARVGEGLGVDPDDLVEMIAGAPINTAADLVSLGARVRASERSEKP